MSTRKSYQEGKGPSTPWGRAQYSLTFARGVASVGCAGHGGIRVSRGLAKKKILPEVLKAAIETPGYFWFEEDCAYSLVVLSMKDLFFDPQIIESAKNSARNYFPEEYELITGEKVDPKDSYSLQRSAFFASTNDRFVVWSARNKDGMVEVHARRASDKAEQTAMVSKEDYDGRGEFGYILPIAS